MLIQLTKTKPFLLKKFFNRNGFVCTEKGELLNNYVSFITISFIVHLCVDVVRTVGVRLLDMRGLC